MNKVFPDTYTPVQHIRKCLWQLNIYKDYVKRYEHLIKEELEDYGKYLNDDNYYFELGPRFNFERNHFHNLSTEFPNTQRRATIISLFSFFEHRLNVFCDVYNYINNSSITLTDMKGKGIDRARLYLKKVAKIDFPDYSKTWHELKNIQEIRNIIVHKDSELTDNDEKMEKYIDSSPHLEIYNLSSYKELRIKETFLDYFIKVLVDFFVEIENKLS